MISRRVLTNRWSSRLRISPSLIQLCPNRRRGLADTAALLNSMLRGSWVGSRLVESAVQMREDGRPGDRIVSVQMGITKRLGVIS
jgi:hypothetical protein